MPNHLRTLMPNFARHEGRWIGTYTHIHPDGEVIDRYEVRIFAEFPTDGSCDFRLHAHDVWPDGRESHAAYDTVYRDGRLWFEGALVGSLWEVDDFTVYLRFGFALDPAIDICEMIQISRDGQSRARTWHWFREEKLLQITLTNERRATPDDPV
jgi:hypothetical protein